jgi:hypothetical protein
LAQVRSIESSNGGGIQAEFLYPNFMQKITLPTGAIMQTVTVSPKFQVVPELCQLVPKLRTQEVAEPRL